MNGIKIRGMGRCVPERVITNADLAERVDTSDDQSKFPGRGVQQALHGVEREEKAGAGGAEVKAGDVPGQAQLPRTPSGIRRPAAS